MKKIIYLSILICFVSCTKSPLKEVVEKKIIADELSVKEKPKFYSFEVIDTVKVKTLIDNWYLVNGENLKKDSVKPALIETIKRQKWLFGSAECIGMSKKECDNIILTNQYKLDRINYLEKKSANDIEYLVIKTEFSLNYSIFNDMKFSQIRIYFVSKKYDTSLKKEIYEVILSESINDYNLIKEKLKSDKITLYESILFNFKTEIPIY